MKNINLKSITITLSIVIALVIFTTLSLYVNQFTTVLSTTHTRWGEFGSFFGGVIGPFISIIAFLGLIVSIRQTSEQFTAQRNESLFFNLLNIYISKKENILKIDFNIEGNDTSDVNGINEVILKFKESYNQICLNECIKAIISNPQKLPPFTYYNLLDPAIKRIEPNLHSSGPELAFSFFSSKVKNMESSEEMREALKLIVPYTDKNFSDDKKEQLILSGQTIIRCNMREKERINIIKEIYVDIAYRYGYIFDHYIGIIISILNCIDNSNENKKYAEIFKTQLSRHELTLIFYYMTSHYSDEGDNINSFNALIKKYNILEKIHTPDICYEPYDFDSLSNDLDILYKTLN